MHYIPSPTYIINAKMFSPPNPTYNALDFDLYIGFLDIAIVSLSVFDLRPFGYH